MALIATGPSVNARKDAVAFPTSFIRYLLPLLPFTILILSLVEAWPSQFAACGLETHWSHLFRTKNEFAIRTIEQGLQCCGLNSLVDRAFPFPSATHGIDAAACERTLGYTRRCLEPWRRQEAVAAGLVALASLFSWIVLVSSYALLQTGYAD